MTSSKKFYVFMKMVKNAYWYENLIYPLFLTALHLFLNYYCVCTGEKSLLLSIMKDYDVWVSKGVRSETEEEEREMICILGLIVT